VLHVAFPTSMVWQVVIPNVAKSEPSWTPE
jgi:hypothetical protein